MFLFGVFCFKQKTAYEMRISDWSSDVCSSDLVLACTASLAASYPDRPVTIVVPFPAGGTTDVLARRLGNGLAEKWGVSVVVENKGGASGTIGRASCRGSVSQNG